MRVIEPRRSGRLDKHATLVYECVVSEALVRRRYFSAMRQAVVDLWGEDGLHAVARALPKNIRDATLDVPIIAEEWLPATAAMAWFEAVWEGGAQRKGELFGAFVDRQTEVGFGRVRRLLLSYATPPLVIARATKLWRDDNSAGELVAIPDTLNRVIVELRDHVYATTPLARLTITEFLRCVLRRCRARNVTGSGVLRDDGSLRMQFTWTNA